MLEPGYDISVEVRRAFPSVCEDGPLWSLELDPITADDDDLLDDLCFITHKLTMFSRALAPIHKYVRKLLNVATQLLTEGKRDELRKLFFSERAVEILKFAKDRLARNEGYEHIPQAKDWLKNLVHFLEDVLKRMETSELESKPGYVRPKPTTMKEISNYYGLHLTNLAVYFRLLLGRCKDENPDRDAILRDTINSFVGTHICERFPKFHWKQILRNAKIRNFAIKTKAALEFLEEDERRKAEKTLGNSACMAPAPSRPRDVDSIVENFTNPANPSPVAPIPEGPGVSKVGAIGCRKGSRARKRLKRRAEKVAAEAAAAAGDEGDGETVVTEKNPVCGGIVEETAEAPPESSPSGCDAVVDGSGEDSSLGTPGAEVSDPVTSAEAERPTEPAKMVMKAGTAGGTLSQQPGSSDVSPSDIDERLIPRRRPSPVRFPDLSPEISPGARALPVVDAVDLPLAEVLGQQDADYRVPARNFGPGSFGDPRPRPVVERCLVAVPLVRDTDMRAGRGDDANVVITVPNERAREIPGNSLPAAFASAEDIQDRPRPEKVIVPVADVDLRFSGHQYQQVEDPTMSVADDDASVARFCDDIRNHPDASESYKWEAARKPSGSGFETLDGRSPRGLETSDSPRSRSRGFERPDRSTSRGFDRPDRPRSRGFERPDRPSPRSGESYSDRAGASSEGGSAHGELFTRRPLLATPPDPPVDPRPRRSDDTWPSDDPDESNEGWRRRNSSDRRGGNSDNTDEDHSGRYSNDSRRREEWPRDGRASRNPRAENDDGLCAFCFGRKSRVGTTLKKHVEKDCFYSPRGVTCVHCNRHGHNPNKCRNRIRR